MVDPGFMVDPVHPSTPDQPQNPNQPLNPRAHAGVCLVDLAAPFRLGLPVDEDRLKRHELADVEWARLEPLLPSCQF
jgi:hypothetical protein